MALVRSGTAGNASLLQWFTGIRYCIPAALQNWFTPEKGRVLIDLSQSGRVTAYLVRGKKRRVIGQAATIGTGEGLAEGIRRAAIRVGRRYELLLPSAAAIEKRVQLPKETRSNLRKVLAYQLGRETPFNQDQAWFDCRIESADSEERLRVRLSVVPRAVAAEWIERIERHWDGSVVSIRPAHDEEFDYLRGSQRQTGNSWHAKLLLAMLGLVILTALALPVVPLIKKHQMLDRLEQKLLAVKREALPVLTLRDQYDVLAESVSFLLKQQERWPAPLGVLDSLTEKLPDHTWIQRFEMRDAKVTLRGESTEAVSLIGILEKGDEFDQVAFVAPLTRNARVGTDIFQISLTVANGTHK
ncbi:MAG: PilN domain-containing protein [Chromatiales bacterium]|nr:PilN domain-containing protein [Chromatiales bacterium]